MAFDKKKGGTTDYRYQGTDELKSTVCLTNYNKHICSLFAEYATGPMCLDYGAGIGVLATLMSNKTTVYCLEPDSSMADHLRALGYVVYGDSCEIPSASIPYVFSSNVLEHIEDDTSALNEMYRILKPGGRIALYLPAFQMLWTKMDDHVGHFRRYTRDCISKKVIESGFRPLDSFYVDSLGFLATLLYKRQKDYQPPQPNILKVYDSCVFPLSRGLDCVVNRFVGKNVFITAEKPV